MIINKVKGSWKLNLFNQDQGEEARVSIVYDHFFNLILYYVHIFYLIEHGTQPELHFWNSQQPNQNHALGPRKNLTRITPLKLAINTLISYSSLTLRAL